MIKTTKLKDTKYNTLTSGSEGKQRKAVDESVWHGEGETETDDSTLIYQGSDHHWP